MPQGRLQKEQVCELGNQFFDERIRELVKDRDPKLYVVIDVNSGDFEIGNDAHAITETLRTRHPESQFFRRHLGTPYAARFGWRATMELWARRGNAP